MNNWMVPIPQGGSRPSTSSTERRKKLPQAKSAVANSTSHGTRRANTLAGVASRISAPMAPPTRLMRVSVRIVRPGGLFASARPVKPVTSWAGNSAMVEVMLAARASMPVSISDGRVMNEPPPASAFCVPAQIAAMKRTTREIVIDLPRACEGRASSFGVAASGGADFGFRDRHAAGLQERLHPLELALEAAGQRFRIEDRLIGQHQLGLLAFAERG